MTHNHSTAGLDITNLNLSQIGEAIKPYLESYFPGLFNWELQEDILTEVTELDYDEVEHLLIQPRYYQLLHDGDRFRSGAGCLTTDEPNKDYTAILVMNETQTRALTLYVDTYDHQAATFDSILVKDFVNNPISESYTVEVTESLTYTKTVTATDEEEALAVVTKLYYDREIVLDDSNFFKVGFSVVNIRTEPTENQPSQN